jgi:hypothetical protein
MRDALSLTDQAIAYSANEVTESAVSGMLGALDQTYWCVCSTRSRPVTAPKSSRSPTRCRCAACPDGAAGSREPAASDRWAQFAPGSVLDEWPEAADLRRFAQTLSPEKVQLFYQIATVGRASWLGARRICGFTMTLRMLAFEPAVGSQRARGGEPAVPRGCRRLRRARPLLLPLRRRVLRYRAAGEGASAGRRAGLRGAFGVGSIHRAGQIFGTESIFGEPIHGIGTNPRHRTDPRHRHNPRHRPIRDTGPIHGTGTIGGADPITGAGRNPGTGPIRRRSRYTRREPCCCASTGSGDARSTGRCFRATAVGSARRTGKRCTSVGAVRS